jgi:type I restriction enzyme S subunit
MKRQWPTVPLGEVVLPVERAEAPIAGKAYRQIGVRLWGAGAYERERIDGAQTKYQTLSRVEADDIIVNKIWARNGSVAVVSEALAGCYGSNEFPTFAPIRGKLAPRWFHWLTKTKNFWEQCDEKSRGTSGKNRIRPERFLEIKIPLPPLPEQRRIVARIEELAAKIEEARGLRRQAVEEAEALVVAAQARVFEEALTQGTTRLDNLATLERGKFSHRPRNDPRFFGGNHPWIQIAEIEASKKYIQQWSQTLNDDGLTISRKFPKGTLLVSIAATIGAVGILDFACCIPDSIVAVTPKAGIDSEYLYYYLGYLRSHLEQVAPQSAQKNINLEILSPLPTPALSLSEQRRIVAYLNTLQAKADTLECLQTETAAELDALLPSVLDKAFKGELMKFDRQNR